MSASSGNGRCNSSAFGASAASHKSTSSGVVRMTGMALAMNRLDNRVSPVVRNRSSCSPSTGALLWATHAAPWRPQASEGEQRPIVAQREPFWRLARLRVSVFAKRGRRDNAAARLPEPSAPVRARDVSNIRHRLTAELRRPRHAPSRHDKRALASHSTPNDRRHLVGEDCRKQRQIANAIVPSAKQIADRRLALVSE